MGDGVKGNRDPFTHQLELCLEAEQEPRSSQGDYSADSEQDCENAASGNGSMSIVQTQAT